MSKSNKKAIVLMMFAALSVVSFGCAKAGSPLPATELGMAEARGIVAGITGTDEVTAQDFKDMKIDELESFFTQYGYSIDGEAFLNGLDGWLGQRNEIGEIIEIGEPVMTSDEKEVTAVMDLKGSRRDGKCVIILDGKDKITSITISAKYTFAENMEKAGLNTLLGMGTTFAILIFLSLVISLFKLIPNPEDRAKREEAPVDNAVSQIAEREELSNDDELVAVITAAVAAYEASNGGQAVTSDGFVVRSIRRHY